MEATIESILAFRNNVFGFGIALFISGFVLLYYYLRHNRNDKFKYMSYMCGWLSIVFQSWYLTMVFTKYMAFILFVMFTGLMLFIYNGSMALYIFKTERDNKVKITINK